MGMDWALAWWVIGTAFGWGTLTSPKERCSDLSGFLFHWCWTLDRLWADLIFFGFCTVLPGYPTSWILRMGPVATFSFLLLCISKLQTLWINMSITILSCIIFRSTPTTRIKKK